MVFVGACGKGGKSGAKATTTSSIDVTGSLAGQTGSSSELEGWVIALVDAATGEARSSEIAADGTFSFKSARKDKVYTLALFNIDYRLTALLSMVAAETESKVYQYFKLKEKDLSRIVFKGQSMEIGNTDKVTMMTYVASDEDADGIPDGMESASSLAVTPEKDGPSAKSLPSFSLSDSDTDADGVSNDSDPDIDSDGLPNIFDSDDDGNDTLDVFDLDANSDLVLDSAQKIGDTYFTDGVEFALGQVFYKSDGALNLRFSVKVSTTGEKPKSVQLLGPDTFLDDSRIVTQSDSGAEEATDIWDRTLSDTGDSFDDAADDGLYSVKVKIKSGKKLKANQTFFIRLNYGNYSRDFPYMFPDLSVDEVSFSYASASRRVTKSGEPFGEDEESYVWSVSVFNEDGALVHSSATMDATEKRYTIPADDISADESYTARIYAQSLEKVPGFPTYIIESDEKDL